MAVMRNLTSFDQSSNQSKRVIEPEIDMRRPRPRASSATRIMALIRWMMPLGKIEVAAPRRAVARELEEAWPSSDR